MSLDDVIKKHGIIVELEEPQYLKIWKNALEPLGCDVKLYPDVQIISVAGKDFSYWEEVDSEGKAGGTYVYFVRGQTVGDLDRWPTRFLSILESTKGIVKVGKASYFIPESNREIFSDELKEKVEKEPFVDEKGSFQSNLPRDVVEKFKEKLEVLL